MLRLSRLSKFSATKIIKSSENSNSTLDFFSDPKNQPVFKEGYKPRYYSGIQPTGVPHIGNYLGAIKKWVDNSKTGDESSRDKNIFSVVDLHAMTVQYKPRELKPKSNMTFASLLACGLDPKKVILYKQSDIREHSELCWYLGCVTTNSELSGMTQFKTKEGKHGSFLGLYMYPVLMAADILLFRPDLVPVGEDQLQHLQLTRHIAERMNKNFSKAGKVKSVRYKFKPPFAEMVTSGARIKSLQNYTKENGVPVFGKMSKSDTDPFSCINMTDSDKEITKKLKKAVTDPIPGISFDKIERPAVSNLMNIYSGFTGDSLEVIEGRYKESGKVGFKNDLTQILVDKIGPIREEILRLENDPGYIQDVMDEGAERAREIASNEMENIRKFIGL